MVEFPETPTDAFAVIFAVLLPLCVCVYLFLFIYIYFKYMGKSLYFFHMQSIMRQKLNF